MSGEEKSKIEIPKATVGAKNAFIQADFKMTGEEQSKIEILKATVDRGREEQDRDPEGHGGRHERTYFN